MRAPYLGEPAVELYDAVLSGGPRDGLTFRTSVNPDGLPGWPGMGYDYGDSTAWYRLDAAAPRDASGRFVWQFEGFWPRNATRAEREGRAPGRSVPRLLATLLFLTAKASVARWWRQARTPLLVIFLVWFGLAGLYGAIVMAGDGLSAWAENKAAAEAHP